MGYVGDSRLGSPEAKTPITSLDKSIGHRKKTVLTRVWQGHSMKIDEHDNLEKGMLNPTRDEREGM